MRVCVHGQFNRVDSGVGEAETAVIYVEGCPVVHVLLLVSTSQLLTTAPIALSYLSVVIDLRLCTIKVMTTSPPIELDTRNATEKPTSQVAIGLEDQERADAKDNSLPPQDGGPGAWLFLFGACVFEIVSWGKYPMIRCSNPEVY